MSKKGWVVTVLSLFILSCGINERDIPWKAGNWRIAVGPAGNEFHEIFSPSESTPPPDAVFQLVRDIAPAYTEITKWKQAGKDLYFIRAEAAPEEYDFIITSDAGLVRLEYENNATYVEEEADELVLKGGKKRIELTNVPPATLKTLSKVIPDTVPGPAWAASTVAGKRYAVAVGQIIFYARPDGQIQAAGLKKNGALREIDPPDKKKTREEIMAELREQLGPYRERFNFENQIEKLGKRSRRADGGYRFVVMGDSRSNPDLWFSMVRHIDQLDPRPEFVINTGDIVPHGFSEEYLEYYIPPLMETGIPYFVAIGNHDDGSDGRALEFLYLFGENALNYYFDFGITRYVFVDTTGTEKSGEETLAWLDTVLKDTPEGFHIIVAAHKPVAAIKKWEYHSLDREYSQYFVELMKKYSVGHVFFGHIHAYSTMTLDGTLYTVSGGGGASLHDRFGPLGNVHHYIICDVMPDGSMTQKVVRFHKL
ncbi:MAG: hypothetical protein GY737_24095 [Desulfobacteraceae bacterium]|nr:hypothetical protein [Desulfobacteraceae bacterium]